MSVVKNVLDPEGKCDHAASMPAFDEEKAKKVEHSWQVRKLWPRHDGPCATCGESVILYASMAHYVHGDW